MLLLSRDHAKSSSSSQILNGGMIDNELPAREGVRGVIVGIE
jgi:hypothetical protein